jgi:IS30 family transposase
MPAHKKLKYLLTLVDTFSRWVETFPTMGESSEVVSTHLIKCIIPQFELPRTLQSDSGLAFIFKVTQIVSSTLGVTWNLHIPYHPKSSGKVERMNGIIKGHLKKTVQQAPLTQDFAIATGTDSDQGHPQRPLFPKPFRNHVWPPISLG